MYLQRNENTITFSLFWALHFSHLLPGLLVIELVQTYLITEVSASIYILADWVCVWVCVFKRERVKKSETDMSVCVSSLEHFFKIYDRNVGTIVKQKDNTNISTMYV